MNKMNKEELEKETAEYFKSICGDYNEEYERTGKRHYWVGFDIKNAYLAGAESREKRIEEFEKENAELKADNDARKFAMAMSEKVEKQLREENAELRKEWQEQVQKATDEGYARTLQTIQLTNAKELLKNILAISVHDKRQCTYDAYILTVKEAEQFLKDSEVEK